MINTLSYLSKQGVVLKIDYTIIFVEPPFLQNQNGQGGLCSYFKAYNQFAINLKLILAIRTVCIEM